MYKYRRIWKPDCVIIYTFSHYQPSFQLLWISFQIVIFFNQVQMSKNENYVKKIPKEMLKEKLHNLFCGF